MVCELIMAILKAGQVVLPSLPHREVKVPELGGSVIVQPMRLSTRWLMSTINEQDGIRWLIKMLADCVRDADGHQLMTEDEWDQFGTVHEEAVVKLADECREMSSLTDDVDDTKGNLKAVQDS
jgi:hypothetical protein